MYSLIELKITLVQNEKFNFFCRQQHPYSKILLKEKKIEGCYADECSVLRREAEQYIHFPWFCN